MGFFTKLRVKIGDFLKENTIYIILGIIGIFFLYNFNEFFTYLNINWEPISVENNSVAVISEEKFPDRIEQEGRQLIKEFLNHCNNKEYDKAYDMLSEDCKTNEFENREEAIGYMIALFPYERKYEIQAYMSQDKYYIYQVKVYDDFLRTGLTKSRFEYDDEMITIVEEDDGLKLNIRGYILSEDSDGMYEDNNIKVGIKKRYLSFLEESYLIEVTNRSEKEVILNDLTKDNNGQIFLHYGDDTRKVETEENIIISPLQTKEFKISFPKLFDLDNIATEIEFNEIRFTEKYNPNITEYDEKYNASVIIEQ